MAAIATALLLTSPSSASPAIVDTVIEKVESRTAQLRGGSRSLSALAPNPVILPDSDRLTVEKEFLLPVSPGIAEGVDPENLPCLVETICGQPELSILCGFVTSNLDEWNSTRGSGNFFVGEGAGTFFAPLDGAFNDTGTLLQHILMVDLENPAIVENVLAYHVVESDATQNVTDVLVSLENFECNVDITMANNETTRTLCIGDSKHQIGFGNMNMRNLPKIGEGGMETCNGTVAMHFIDQLILPPLPLKPMQAPIPSLQADICPIDRPELNGTCRDPGESCYYGYSYSGCNWGELQCAPSTSCRCTDIDETGTGSWACFVNLEKTLEECAPTNTSEEESAEEKPPLVASGDVPTGRCDPSEPLPLPSDECPATRSESCSGYQSGKSCDFNHIYLGCTWRELTCAPVESCICLDDGSWMCAMMSAERCGNFDINLGRWIDDDIPEGLPWGQGCNPDEALPTPPSVEDVTSRLSQECPSSFSFGSCERHEPGLHCDYNYQYSGCTWETLDCSPIMQCECNLFGDGNWACRSESRLSCSDRSSEGVPLGRCNPDVPLPLPPSTNDTIVAAVASSGTINDEERVDVSLTSSETDEREEAVVLSLMTGGMP